MKRVLLVATAAAIAASMTTIAGCELFIDTDGLATPSADATGPDGAVTDASNPGADASLDGGGDAATPPPIVVVQHVGHPQSATTTVAVTLPQPPAAADALLLFVTSTDDDDVTSVAGGTATYQRIADSTVHAATSIWLASSPAPNDATATVTFASQQTTACAFLVELARLGALADEANASGATTDLQTATLTADPGDLVVAAFGMHNHTVTIASGSPFTELDSVAAMDAELFVALANPAPGGSLSLSATQTDPQGWDAELVRFHRATP